MLLIKIKINGQTLESWNIFSTFYLYKSCPCLEVSFSWESIHLTRISRKLKYIIRVIIYIIYFSHGRTQNHLVVDYFKDYIWLYEWDTTTSFSIRAFYFPISSWKIYIANHWTLSLPKRLASLYIGEIHSPGFATCTRVKTKNIYKHLFFIFLSHQIRFFSYNKTSLKYGWLGIAIFFIDLLPVSGLGIFATTIFPFA